MLRRSVECARGITSACPRLAGLMSMKAIVRSSSSTIVAGISFARILQKRQSGSASDASLDVLRQPGRTGERLLARGDLARVLRLGDRRQQLADPGPRRDVQLAGELVPPEKRPRRTLGAPAQPVRQEARDDLQA